MNEFKKSLLVKEVKSKEILEKENKTKEIDEKIIIGITELLNDMLIDLVNKEKAETEEQRIQGYKDQRVQVTDRMLNLNKLFEKGFAEQIMRLKKVETEKNSIVSVRNDIHKEVDGKISANISKLLFEMSKNTSDSNEKTQILDRMLNINNLFRKGFDEEIRKLKELENNEKEQ